MQKVNWKSEAPWYREISDGLSWIGYCFNSQCEAYKEMVVINRGYSAFSIKDIHKLICPVCKTYPGKGEEPSMHLRNCGFVNCEWVMRGILV